MENRGHCSPDNDSNDRSVVYSSNMRNDRMKRKEKVVGIPEITSDDIVLFPLGSPKRIKNLHQNLFKLPFEKPTMSMTELWNNKRKTQF